jgi:hypothetical protein
MMLWAIAGYRENPKYLDPRDPTYHDKRNKITSLLHEILSDPHLLESANEIAFLKTFLPAYQTHCFENTDIPSLNATLDQLAAQHNTPPLYRWLNRSDPSYSDPFIRNILVHYWVSAERLFGKYINAPKTYPGVRDTKPTRNPNPANSETTTTQPKPTPQNPLPVPSPPVSPPVTSKPIRPPPGFQSLPDPPTNPLPNPPANPPPNPPANPFPYPPPNPTSFPGPQSNPITATNFPAPLNPPPTQFQPLQDTPQACSVPLNTAVPISPSVPQTFMPGSPFSTIQFGDLLLPYTIANFAVPPASITYTQAGQVARTVNPPSTSYPSVRPVWLHEIHRFDYTHNLVIVSRETNATDNGDLLSVTQIIPLKLYYSTYRPDPLALITRVTLQPPAGRPYIPP